MMYSYECSQLAPLKEYCSFHLETNYVTYSCPIMPRGPGCHLVTT